MDGDEIPIERRRHARVTLTRTVSYSVAMRTELETLQNTPGAEPDHPTYEINATVNVRQSRFDKPVRYNLTATMTPDEPGEREYPATIKNISQGGLCMVTSFRLREHQVVRIGIPVPESDVTTPTLAEVRWQADEGGAVRAGLKYLL